MLKITRHDRSHGSIRLLLEGRLTRQEIPALETACDDCRTPGADLLIDLSGVRFADAQGAAVLRRLRREDVVLANATPFVSELLREDLA